MRLCKNCSKIIEGNYRKIFCNRACAASFNNKLRGHKRYCLNCETELSRRNDKRYCNKECRDNKYLVSIEKFILKNGYYYNEYQARKHLLHRWGTECWICKGDNWLGNPMPVVLDHINGDSTDNSISNLRLICPNCDTFTPTYKSKNNGKGRKRRLEKLRESNASFS